MAATFNDYIYSKMGSYVVENWKYAKFLNSDDELICNKTISSISYNSSTKEVSYSISLSYDDFTSFALSDPSFKKNIQKVEIHKSISYDGSVFLIQYDNPIYFETVNDNVNVYFKIQLSS